MFDKAAVYHLHDPKTDGSRVIVGGRKIANLKSEDDTMIFSITSERNVRELLLRINVTKKLASNCAGHKCSSMIITGRENTINY